MPDQNPANRREQCVIRAFISSTFRDMIEDRNELMTHTWPELRRFCRERQVELVEVDLRWGIAEEQSTRKETLKLCLDEIRACRPFFIGLLGERYGWVPGDDAYTADLKEEQPWLKDTQGKSVTELEILHGVLNNPDMAERSFFYFRDPEYAGKRGADFLSENDEAQKKQDDLKQVIRTMCNAKNIPLYEYYPDPGALAALVLEQLKAAIEEEFPKESIPNPIDREARDHEAFAEIRRRTYIGRPDYFETLDRHAVGDGAPLVLLGDSGSGKSALLANWVDSWRKAHPKDFIIQHYIGGTFDSAVHWKVMGRLMAEIKHWTDDPEELPSSNDDMLRDFPVWLSKARIRAQREGVRLIIVLDALNQLEDTDHGRLLSWLPEHLFNGALRLIVSTLSGDTLEVIEKRDWPVLRIQSLTSDERRKMIAHYLERFSKKLDDHRLERIAGSESAANPLNLKILLDELRVTGTHDKLDERLDDYLAAKDIPTLLGKVLARYQRDYERDRKDLVSETLRLIWAARRGLTEAELLQLLRPANLPQLPLAAWVPLRAALEESLVDRGGILNFAHDFLRSAVETAFVPDLDKKDDFRITLAGYFEAQPTTARSSDELPWLLRQAGLDDRLRNCLLHIDRFLEIQNRDEEELRTYWIYLKEEKNMGRAYLESFNAWLAQKGKGQKGTSFAANQVGIFLFIAALHEEAEPLMKLALKIDENNFGKDHPNVAADLNNLALLLQETNHLSEAEPLMKRALKIDEDSFGQDHPNVAIRLLNLARLLKDTNRLSEAEPLYRRALNINENNFGKDHPNVAVDLNNLAQLLQETNRLSEAEPLMKRALKIDEDSFGQDHPMVAIRLNNLALLLKDTNRLSEAEPLYRRALKIDGDSFGQDHPKVANRLNNLAQLLQATNRLSEAEPLSRRMVEIFIKFTHTTGHPHPFLQTAINNYGGLLQAMDWSEKQIGDQLRKIAPKRQETSYVVEEYDLATAAVLKALREKDDQALPDATVAAGKSEVEWYTRESSAKRCNQIIIAEKAVSSCKSPIGGPFICGLEQARMWGMGTFFSDSEPYICVKCVGVEDDIKEIPCRLAFSFYRYGEAGIFQPLLEIMHNTNNPFIVENPWNLKGNEILRVGKDLLSRSHIVLQFFDENMLGIHARVIKPPQKCMNAIRALFEDACKYNNELVAPNFRAAENRYYDMNPMEVSPILKK